MLNRLAFVGAVSVCFLLVAPTAGQNTYSPTNGNGFSSNGAERNLSSQPTSSAVPLNQQQQQAVEQAAQQAFQQQAIANGEVAPVQQPRRPFPELSAEETDYLHRFLDHWEQQSRKVTKYVCDFRRFEYDPVRCDWRDPNTQQLAAATVAFGQIRYAEPDRGYYETTEIFDFAGPPKSAGEQADYKQRDGEGDKEKWICDGRNIYEFDFQQKRLYETEIPAELQGDGIVNSPIPFLFGARKDQILNRYWVRIIPKENQSIYWLEAYPKRIEDARLYSKIEVIIAANDFLPEGMHVYSPQYDPKQNNMESRYFAFENRQINSQLSIFKDFLGQFVRPSTPIVGGWKRVKRQPLHDQASSPGETMRK